MGKQHSDIYEFIFGSMDGLVTPLGVVSGVAGGTHSTHAVLVAGFAEACAGAVSMAAGEFTADQAEEESVTHKTAYPLRQAFVMGLSYILGAIAPLLPYIILNISAALPASVILTLLALSCVGFIRAKAIGTNILKSMLIVVCFGSLSALVGYLAGAIA